MAKLLVEVDDKEELDHVKRLIEEIQFVTSVRLANKRPMTEEEEDEEDEAYVAAYQAAKAEKAITYFTLDEVDAILKQEDKL